MSAVKEFSEELKKRATGKYATWHKIDLHNHSPSSHDYKGDKSRAIEETAARISTMDLSVVMFTDHGKLPSKEFAEDVSKQSGKIVLRGTELNVFVDAWFKPQNKVDKQPFFHLLVGFDPNGQYSPDFWLDKIYSDCGREERAIGSEKVIGVSSNIDRIIEVLGKSGAILIPAHLHSAPDAFRSRSLDDIYSDPIFLGYAAKFDALEITDLKTAAFFDGNHSEARNVVATCIRSSDAHTANELGMRPTWLQMQTASFSELKAALEFRTRISLEEPRLPDAFVAGIHVQGNYLSDFWLPLSPYCNVFIGVKGSGKTSALECLRFVLGTEVPRASKDQVNAHLNHILGPNGRVRALVVRKDATQVLIEKSVANPGRFQVTFESGRTDLFDQIDAVGFPAQILGWHEIEHAATDSSLRRRYLDEISGRQRIHSLQGQAKAKAEEIRSLNEQASGRYQSFKTLNKQVEAQEQLRRGLQELTDAKLIELKTKYELAVSHKQEMARLINESGELSRNQAQQIARILPYKVPVLAGKSSLESAAEKFRAEIQKLVDLTSQFSGEFAKALGDSERTLQEAAKEAERTFADFAREYEGAINQLRPEQRKLLESHQQVLEQTRGLPDLCAQRERARLDVEAQLRQLVTLCTEVSSLLDERTMVRQQAVQRFSAELGGAGVKVEVKTLQPADSHQEYASKYRHGFEVVGRLQQLANTEATLHRRLKRAYGDMLVDLLVSDRYLVFDQPEFSNYITLFEEDDLAITFDPDGSGQSLRPIDQLSAGQRCTAMFPILLRLREGPLIIDQPEDNLDNRHIAGKIAPVLLIDKRVRQMIFTSHNANLVVIGDPESVVVFDGKANRGEVVAQGFLASRESLVTRYVLDILDGGERALEIRYSKYGAAGRGQ